MLVDSHCHLDRLDLTRCDNSLHAAVEAAKARGVSAMLCVCISAQNKDRVIGIAEDFANIFASVGVHPSDVESSSVTVDTLKNWSRHPKVVAIGETGLDYHYGEDSKLLQQQSFVAHLQAAKEESLPVIVHTREAREDTLALIRSHGCQEAAGVLHCFTENWDMAKRAMDMNYFISISGIVTFRNAEELRDVVRKMPMDRLLVETDSPYLAPIPYRGKPNMPQYVREVAECVAELKKVSLSDLAEQTSANFYRLFKRASRVADSGKF